MSIYTQGIGVDARQATLYLPAERRTARGTGFLEKLVPRRFGSTARVEFIKLGPIIQLGKPVGGKMPMNGHELPVILVQGHGQDCVG